MPTTQLTLTPYTPICLPIFSFNSHANKAAGGISPSLTFFFSYVNAHAPNNSTPSLPSKAIEFRIYLLLFWNKAKPTAFHLLVLTHPMWLLRFGRSQESRTQTQSAILPMRPCLSSLSSTAAPIGFLLFTLVEAMLDTDKSYWLLYRKDISGWLSHHPASESLHLYFYHNKADWIWNRNHGSCVSELTVLPCMGSGGQFWWVGVKFNYFYLL